MYSAAKKMIMLRDSIRKFNSKDKNFDNPN